MEFEEKETYTLAEVQDIMEQQLQGMEDIQKQNHALQVQNLAIKNGIGEDMLDLIFDEDLEKVESKIEKLKELTKEKEIGNSYKPERKRDDDAYEKAIQKGNVQGAIKNKLSKIFE